MLYDTFRRLLLGTKEFHTQVLNMTQDCALSAPYPGDCALMKVISIHPTLHDLDFETKGGPLFLY